MKKKSLTTLMALFISISAYGKEENKAILVEDVSLQHLQDTEKGHICKADMNKNLKQKLKKDAYLIGQMRATPTPDQKGVVQIVWTGIQIKDKKRPKAYFKKPLISTFKVGSPTLTKGTQITLIGDTDQISQALEDLDKGQASQNAQGLDHNPQAAERRVDDARTTHGQRSGHGGNTMQGGGAGDGSGYDQGQTSYQGDHLNSDMNSGTANGSQGNAGSGYGQSAYRSGAGGTGSRASSHSRPYSSQSSGFSSGGMGGSRMYSSGGFNTAMPTSSSTSANGHSQHGTSHAQSQKAGYSEGASPHQGQSTQDEKANLNSQSYDKRTGLDSDDPDGSGSRTAHDADDPFNVEKNKGKNTSSSSYQEIDVEITEQGCKPRIDFEKGKYIIQNRSIMRQGGKIIQETACGDSSTWYPIKKDYGNCQDEIDAIRRVAFTRFQRYWQDKDGVKHYLDNGCIRDESRPHPFIDDVSNCAHFLDILAGKAWRQAESIYYDRANARQVVGSCHKVGEVIPILKTQQKCKPQHLLDRQFSVVQQRAIFTDQGIEHEVLPCHATNQTIAHEFVKDNCKAVVTEYSVVPMAKRQITYEGKKRLITTDCEPLGEMPLQATTAGCEGQFDHDFDVGRSYPKVRWVYTFNGRTKFVTSCVKGKEYFAHQVRPKDYKHDDAKLCSIPLYEISINVNGKSMIIREQFETSESRFLPYTFSKKGYKHNVLPMETWRDRMPFSLNDSLSGILYLKLLYIWKRPDGSLYEQNKGSTNEANLVRNYLEWLCSGYFDRVYRGSVSVHTPNLSVLARLLSIESPHLFEVK